MLKRIAWELIRWIREMSRLTQFGLLVLVVGASIDLVYHGVILTILPLPETQETVVEYAGHLITFCGMILMLVGIVIEARHLSQSRTGQAGPRRWLMSRWVSIRRR